MLHFQYILSKFFTVFSDRMSNENTALNKLLTMSIRNGS